MKPKILIVDDTERSRVLLSDSMEAEGYETETASNGREALLKVETFRPDLILLDVMMPLMDGYETCRRLKSNEATRYIPVLMLTARGELEDKVMGLEVGAEDYIVKPFSIVEVGARVKSFLRMRALQAKLVETEKLAALGEMVNGIAHEIRNPLTSIGGIARRLRNSETHPEHQHYADVILNAVKRMERMMQRIDEYKGILSSRFEPGDLNTVVEAAVEDVRHVIGDKKIEIKASLLSGVPLFSMDRTNLKVAIFNVLQNAVEAIEKEGVVKVETLPASDNTLILTVSDNGVGMEPDSVKKLFNPFYTSKMTGAGLGLTITHRIIQDHRGTIDVESSPGKGTVVTMKFYIAPGSSSAA